jgi:mannose-6-phosphate isomerase-like protein (cupin superfamily)
MTVTRTPWGEFRTLLHYGALEGKSVKVKELVLKPGEKTSYQFHNNRQEMLIPLNDGLEIQFAEYFEARPAFSCCYVEPKEEHQLINTSESNLVILEIQFGSETEESDITRIFDPHHNVRKDYLNAPNS